MHAATYLPHREILQPAKKTKGNERKNGGVKLGRSNLRFDCGCTLAEPEFSPAENPDETNGGEAPFELEVFLSFPSVFYSRYSQATSSPAPPVSRAP
jgi:hypothetical protein